MINNTIELCNVSFSYNEKMVLQHINEVFETGTNTAIMAPSGSGKTTLLFLLAGLLKPTNGTMTYPVEHPRLAMVFQENRLLEQQTILCNLQLVNPRLTATDVTAMLHRAGLSYSVTKKICQLSGGEKRRIAIIRALLSQYDILLLDEPLTGLDDTCKQQILELIEEETKDKTVILVTHDIEEAKALNCKIRKIV